ncbi:MAG TPA: SPOR domain-containing protein [Bacteroidetes bacterium]|nr:SPOR domain-containing protein [Bacteroidota bacterium]HIL57002.1 SPOR domain-containing protein [Rhodothermales bacterium]
MASLSALSAAIRDRLLQDEPAPLPGFGTLRRVRVPARVLAQPDGSRSLRPPSESLRLVLGAEPDPTPLAMALAKQIGLPVGGGASALRQSVEQMEAMLSIKGEVELEGVGVLRRTDRGLLFGADPALLSTINVEYTGLSEVGAQTETAAPQSSGADVPAAPPAAMAPPEVAEEDEPPSDATEPESEVYGDGIADDVTLTPFSIGVEEDAGPSALATSLREAMDEPEPQEPSPGGETDDSAADQHHDPATDDLPPGLADWFGQRPLPSEPAPDSDEPEAPTPMPADELLSDAPLHQPPAPEPPAPDAREDDDAVDSLLAGIWSTGMPTPDHLGTSASLDDTRETPPADPSPAETSSPTASEPPPPPAAPEPADPPAAPPREEPVSPAPVRTEPPASVPPEAAETDRHQPEGLPLMPPGWAPSGDYDDEYEEMRRPRRVWPLILAALALLALIAAAVLLWPRFTTAPDPLADVPAAPDTPAAVPSDEALALDEEPDALDPADSLAAAAAREAEALLAEEPSAEERMTEPDAAPEDASSSTPTASASRATTPAATPTPPAPQPVRPAPTSSGGPDLSGLSQAAARGLAGDAPIQLDAEGFTWVVSSVSSRAEAEAAVARYRRAGFRARVIEGTVNGRPMYRIAIGQFASRQDAYSVRDRLPADIRGRDDIWTLNLADV